MQRDDATSEALLSTQELSDGGVRSDLAVKGQRSTVKPSYAALRRRELDAQLQVPQVQRMALQSLHTVKSTEPK